MRVNIAVVATAALVLTACGGSQIAESPAAPDRPALAWNVEGDSTRTDSLGGPDVADADGFFSDHYALRLEPGQTYRFVVRSRDFDTVVRVRGPGGLDLRNDDRWDGTNSMVQFQAREAEGYELAVTSYAPASTGNYEVAVIATAPAAGSDVLAADQVWISSVEAGDNALGASRAAWIEARAGQRLRFRVTSRDFDARAWLFAPDGDNWFNDDANDTGPDGSESTLDSTIDAIAPTDGWYQLVVAPYDPSDTGAFSVTTSVRAPVVVGPDDEIPAVGYAGSHTGGRIFGVFAGITEYGADDVLFGCADDATFLAEAFRHRRLQAEADQVVLTNKSATVGAFTRALQDLVHRAGPEDVVVIFFSGHGGIDPVDRSRDRVELDGTDETLVFTDGRLRDNDFAALLDALKVDTIVVAIDACQSGGFARDIMTRPGRIGLFSSDEDVLSATAEPVGAGGYLSYLMRRAVLGDADSRPSDGALMAGELADFMIEGGVTYHRDMNPEGATDPLQRVLIERGSYGWADVLWVFPRHEDGTSISGDLCLETPPADGDASTGGVCR